MLESSCNPDVVQVQSGWSLELPRVQRGYVLPYPTCLLVQYTLLYTCASHIRPPYRFQGAPVQTLKVCSYVFIHSTGIQQDMQEQGAFNKNQ